MPFPKPEPEPTPAVVWERHPGVAASPLPPTYRPRRPELQPLYRIVADHVETLLAEPLVHGAPPYPRHVEHEFRRLLTCGIPAHGFYRVRCPDCGHERLLGLSCAGRLCPSCWGRRMADGAAHLVDRVLPSVPFRQVVLSVPYRLRFHLARDGRFLSQMLTAHLQTVFAWQRSRGRAAGIDDGHTGAITFVQRFGGALNLNVHFHTITPDGLFVATPDDDPETTLRFVPLPPPTDDQVAHLTRRVARRLQKRARRYLEGHQDALALVDPDDEEATLQHALSTALRPPVRPQRALLPGLDEDPEPPPVSPLCARVAGYSLHAARVVAAHDRQGLERLCRYGLRAPFSQQRLSYLPDGRVHYRLDKPWPTPAGTTDLVMDPVQFLKRLAALLPPPYQNQIRYHGCFANRSRFRKRLPLPPPATDDDTPQLSAPHTDGDDPETEPEPEPQPQPALAEPTETRPRRLPWARLLKRTLGVDGLDCPTCHAQMLVIALITKADVVQKILDHLRLPATPPPVAPPRHHPADAQTDLLDFNQEQTLAPRRAASAGSSRSARAPPRAPPRA